MGDKTRKKAVALKYERHSDSAPRVVAKGKGLVAERILQIAAENKIPLYHDDELTQVLEALDLNSEIPPDLYKAVAEVLAFIYRMNKKSTS